MKKIALLALFGALAFAARSQLRAGGPEPLYDEPYVVVYGRDSCGLTSQMRQELRRAGVPFDYQVIDAAATEELVHERMQQSGLSTRRYPLPVVDVSGTILVGPQPADVAAAFLQSRSAPASAAP